MASILMIDDDLDSIKDIKEVLSCNHGVDVAVNIDHAVSSLTNNRYDLVFLDLYMPHRERYTAENTKLGRETGYRLLREIRSRESHFRTQHDVPVIVLTFIRMETDPDLRDRVLAEQPLDCLEKPESLPDIIRLVEKRLQRT